MFILHSSRFHLFSVLSAIFILLFKTYIMSHFVYVEYKLHDEHLGESDNVRIIIMTVMVFYCHVHKHCTQKPAS